MAGARDSLADAVHIQFEIGTRPLHTLYPSLLQRRPKYAWKLPPKHTFFANMHS